MGGHVTGHVQGSTERLDVAVVIVHGFGCGVFSWRAVQQPLADATGCLVLLFDRPAFGALPLPAFPSCPKGGSCFFPYPQIPSSHLGSRLIVLLVGLLQGPVHGFDLKLVLGQHEFRYSGLHVAGRVT